MGNTQSDPLGIGPLPVTSISHANQQAGVHEHATEQETSVHADGNFQDRRVVVDIRGADFLERDDLQLTVHRRAPHPYQQQIQQTNATLQGLLTITISCLTVGKLIEEIRFIRALRGELRHIAASFADGEGGGGAGHVGGGGRGGDATSFAASQQPWLGTPDLASGLAAVGAASFGPGAAEAAAAGSSPAASGGAVQGWAAISGLTETKKVLQEVTVLPTLRPDLFTGIRQPPRGILLFGPPGSGKTLLARAVAAESRASFFPVTGSSVLSMWYGQSEANVRALFERARQQQPAVIFIDEVDSLLGRRGGGADGGVAADGAGGGGPDKRVTNEFLAFIDGIQTEHGDARITIMAATNNPWALDEAALSRFARRVYVPLPDRAARATLLAASMAGLACDLSAEQYLALADKCRKYSGRDLVAVCREAAMRPLRELWGSRLLDAGPGGSMGAEVGRVLAQQRLVALLGDHIKRGKKVKKLRKELVEWQRRQKGAADWCDIEATLASAMEAVVGSGGGGGRGGKPVRQPRLAQTAGNEDAAAHSDEGSPHSPESCEAGVVVEKGGKQGRRGWMRGRGRGAATASMGHAAAMAATRAAAVAATVVSAAAGSGHSHSLPTCPNLGRQGASTSSGGSAPVGACASAAAPQCGHGSGCTACPVGCMETSVCGGGQMQRVASGSLSNPALVALAQAATSTAPHHLHHHQPAPPKPVHTRPRQASQGGRGQSTKAPTTPLHHTPSDSAPAAAATATTADRADSGGGAKEEGSALSGVAELLAMPAEKLRAVTMSDFETALHTIMPTEFDLTARYEEFNARYGSGADTKRDGYASHARYMHIYT